jgi:hypothetical protein
VYRIYGIDLKNGMWNMEWPKSWNLWNFWNGISQIMEFYYNVEYSEFPGPSLQNRALKKNNILFEKKL